MAFSMVASAGIGAAASIFGSSAQSKAAKRAADIQQQMFNTGKAALDPFITGAQSNIPLTNSLLRGGPDAMKTLEGTPGFQFANLYGNKAITNAGTSRGLGGNVMTEAGKYSSGLAANNTYFPLINALQGNLNMGSGAATSLMGGANTAGGNIGGSLINQGNAQAAGIAGVGSSINNALSGGMNLQLLNALTGGKIGLYGTPQQA